MGGWTQINLSEPNEENINIQNAKLEGYGVPKKYRFYTELDIRKEYEYYKLRDGNFPDFLFRGVNTYEGFRKAWLDWTHLKVGGLHFDCYYGRTGKLAMRRIGKYIAENVDLIASVSGSFGTFMERGMTKKEIEICKGIKTK